MKKYLIFILSIVAALLTWIPNTRLFLTDSNIGTILILVLAIFVCVFSVIYNKHSRSLWYIFSFVLGLSPILFLIFVGIFLALGMPFAP